MFDLPPVYEDLRNETAHRLRQVGWSGQAGQLRREAGQRSHMSLPRVPESLAAAWNATQHSWAHAGWQAGYLTLCLTPLALSRALSALAEAPAQPARPGLSLRLCAQLQGGLAQEEINWSDPAQQQWAWRLITLTHRPDARQVRSFEQSVAAALCGQTAPRALALATLPVAVQLDRMKEEGS